MDLGLSGKRFLVTGGTRGIGRAVVEGLLAEGASVAYCARTADVVAETQSALAAGGATAIGSAVDVGDAAALTGWVNDSFTALGGIDGVVANVSALAIPDSIENWHTSFDVDLMGTVGLVEAALPHLLASGAGSIVTISSVSGREIDFAAGPYGTMKAAIIH
ncbi:MAG TPA: SDR family NAD(P)-dependent oxidoreductase, partial [Mycobacterium sp.]|nr:SDR family NAD(P)-dependent oxidoreductase [Mycobacterium sp.]